MKKIEMLFFAFSFFSSTFAQYAYPSTKTVDSSDTYFGVKYKDPYRWMEKMEEPEVETWFKHQAIFADSILRKLKGRDELIAEWKKLDVRQPPFISRRIYENGRIFYLKSIPGDNADKLYYREGINGKEELLFDPADYIHGKTLSIARATPSYDGKKIGILYTEKGAEIGTLKIMIVDTKEFLKDSITNSIGISNWTFDNKGFLYSYAKSGDSKDPQSRLNSKTKTHVIGNDVREDVDFFSNETYPELNISPEKIPYIFLTEDSKKYVFAGIGSSASELTQYYAPIEQFYSRKIEWKILCDASDSLVRPIFSGIHEDVGFTNNKAFALSHYHAPNYKIVATSLEHPDWKHGETIAFGKTGQTLQYFVRSKDYLLIVYSDGINNHLSKYNLRTKTATDVITPFNGTIGVHCFNTKSNHCVVVLNSWVKPFTEFNYDAQTDSFSRSDFNAPLVYPANYYELQADEVEIKGYDGVMIPLTIIHKSNIKKEGSNICLLTGYGAYGFPSIPYLDDFLNSLAVYGVVVAIAHVRGGGEKGNAWYMGGFKTTKPNTWKDFISCAEYLVADGYTSPQKLAGYGKSAGGILISRAITERPDLFAAAICDVGCANAMRFEFTANGPVNIAEFGTVKDCIECKALYEMDGVQHVWKDIKYPAVLCVGAWNDARVPAWQPGKFAAALQNNSVSGKIVLLKINYNGGHFGDDKEVTYTNFADQYAFLLWQCGNPDFQPEK